MRRPSQAGGFDRLRRHLARLEDGGGAGDGAGTWSAVQVRLRRARRVRIVAVVCGGSLLAGGLAAAVVVRARGAPRGPHAVAASLRPAVQVPVPRLAPRPGPWTAPERPEEAPPHVAGADAFVDSIGVHVRLGEQPESFPVVQARLAEAGIRHVSDLSSSRLELLASLESIGARTNLAFAVGEDVHAAVASAGTWLEAVTLGKRGLPSDAVDWAGEVRAWIERSHAALKADAATRSVPIVGPQVADEERRRSLGDLSPFVDFAALGNPVSIVPPGGAYLDGMLAVYRPVYGADRPLFVPMFYYRSTRSPDGGGPRVQAKYVLRAFFENWRRGVVRSYVMQLVDPVARSAPAGDDLGLVAFDGTPKPAFVALRNTVRLLADPGPAYAPAPVGLDLAGDTRDVERVVLRRRDGTVFVALWLSLASGDEDLHQPLGVRPHFRYLVALAHDPRSGATKPLGAAPDGSLALDVSDAVTLLEIRTR